jgi:hypothetical protein
MKRVILLVTMAASLTLVACDKQEPKQADPTTQTTPAATTPTAPTAAAPAAPTVIADNDIVTAADFEDEAEKTITAKTYKAEIASLEAELSKD